MLGILWYAGGGGGGPRIAHPGRAHCSLVLLRATEFWGPAGVHPQIPVICLIILQGHCRVQAVEGKWGASVLGLRQKRQNLGLPQSSSLLK